MRSTRKLRALAMRSFSLVACVLALGSFAACGSCSKGDMGTDGGGGASSGASGAVASGAIPEALPRCRGDAQRLAIPGEDVVVGDVAIGAGGLLVGVVRIDGGKRIASVMRAPLDLASTKMIDVGVPLGDDPPPSPRWNGATPWTAFYARRSNDAGTKVRELDVARIEENGTFKVEASILQQADESTAFDIAWNDSGAGLVAWDEDAPLSSDAGARPGAAAPFEGRGFVKVQALGSTSRRVASPESSDAEMPKLLARPGGGFWLAWLARRAEEEAYAVEGPGEKRAFRWVEAVPLSATGDAAGPLRRVTSEKGRAAAFELARSGNDLVVMVQDEAAPSEGAGARIVRYLVGEKVESADVVDGGVGSAVAELVPAIADAKDGGATRWLAWNDLAERTHLTPLTPLMTRPQGSGRANETSSEPALDGTRVLAAVPPNGLYALVFAPPSDSERSEGSERRKNHRPELRRFSCSAGAE
jgi:hypothetical protein